MLCLLWSAARYPPSFAQRSCLLCRVLVLTNQDWGSSVGDQQLCVLCSQGRHPHIGYLACKCLAQEVDYANLKKHIKLTDIMLSLPYTGSYVPRTLLLRFSLLHSIPSPHLYTLSPSLLFLLCVSLSQTLPLFLSHSTYLFCPLITHFTMYLRPKASVIIFLCWSFMCEVPAIASW